MFNFYVKRLLVVACWVLLYGESLEGCICEPFSDAGFSGVVCISDSDNNGEHEFAISYNPVLPDDLVFWKTPDGYWTNQTVFEHHINPVTYNPAQGKVYLLRKDEVDFATISIPSIPGAGSCNLSSTIPTVSIGTPPPPSLEISSSWSPTVENWVYVIMNIINTTPTTANATFILQHDNDEYLFDDLATITSNTSGYQWYDVGNKTSHWTFDNLLPGERRYAYAVYHVSPNSPESSCGFLSSVTFSSDKQGPVGTGFAQETLQTRLFPHDPNSIVINASYGDEYQNYYFCQSPSEILRYTVNFHNQGPGTAKDVDIEIDINEVGYVLPNTLNFIESDHIITDFTYEGCGIIRASFENINLPGLNDPTESHSYHETTGYLRFDIQTKCNLLAGTELPASADITFISVGGQEMDVEETNVVTAMPDRSGNPENCIACASSIGAESDCDGGSGKKSLDKLTTKALVSISPNPCSDYTILTYKGTNTTYTTQITLLDIAGRKYKEWTVNNEAQQMTIDTKDLESGLYFVHLKNGEKHESHKLLKW